MSSKCIFTERLPRLRVDKGMVYMDVDHRDGSEVCVTMHTFEAFLETGRRLVVDWHAKPDPVVPLARKPAE